MNPKLATGLSNFKDLVFKSDIFVDKSLFIKEIIENNSSAILITRPRRWGKSMNLSMLEHFFTIELDKTGQPLPIEERINPKLFLGGEVDIGYDTKKILKPLNIAKEATCLKKQGEIPVIIIDFKECKGMHLDEIINALKNSIYQAFNKYAYLLESSVLTQKEKEIFQLYINKEIGIEEIRNSLQFLSQMLCKHFERKVIILIDEYDTPLNHAYVTFGLNSPELNELLLLFRVILGAALKGNDALEKGVITGILRIAKANLFSDLNNVDENTLLDQDFAKSYGFTQAEVDFLLSQYSLETSSEEIKKWYNGYTFGGEIIYNPWSIAMCLTHQGTLKPYWMDSGGIGLVNTALISDEVQNELQNLLAGKSIIKHIYTQISFEELHKSKGMLYSLLLFAGYLNPVARISDDPTEFDYELGIPNLEVRQLYIERVQQWVVNRLAIQVDDYHYFVNLLREPDLDTFAEKFEKFLLGATSYHDAHEEKHYHSLMNGLLASLANKYIQKSNQEAGLGRFDHLLVPREGKGNTALIFEYKVSKTPEKLDEKLIEAFEQIELKKYTVILKDYSAVKQLYKVAIAFCGKQMKMKFEKIEVS